MFPFSDLTLLVGWQEGHGPVKSWVLVCWWWQFDHSFARLTAPVATTISIILSFYKIQNGAFWYWLIQVHLEKWLLKQRERDVNNNFTSGSKSVCFVNIPVNWCRVVETCWQSCVWNTRRNLPASVHPRSQRAVERMTSTNGAVTVSGQYTDDSVI